MQHNMSFADFKLLKVDFSLNKDFKENSKEEKKELISPEFSIQSDFRENENELVVILGVRHIKGNIPYYFEVKAGGLFKFKEKPQEQLLKQFATINCPSIVFPYLRETIADLTRRAGFPPLHLAPINFVELAKGKEEKALKKEKTIKPVKKSKKSK